MVSTPRAILFDHDGVLVASEPIHWVAWEKLMGELGIQVPRARIQALVGLTSPLILTSLMDEFRPDWDKSQLPQFVQRKNDIYLEEAPYGLQAYPGVREGLEWMKAQGIPAAVVSNARRRELVAVLESLDLAKYFATIISRDDAGVPKPDPTPYLMAAGIIGVEPKDCFAVEDSPPGMEAALLAKIPTAGVLTNFNRRALENPVPGRPDLKPFWVGDSMEQFFEMVRKKN